MVGVCCYYAEETPGAHKTVARGREMTHPPAHSLPHWHDDHLKREREREGCEGGRRWVVVMKGGTREGGMIGNGSGWCVYMCVHVGEGEID